MPNLITGLKYVPVYPKLETEQQLLNVFFDLKKEYLKFARNFKVLTLDLAWLRNKEVFECCFPCF